MPKLIFARLNDKPFRLILEGKKTWEGRKLKPKWELNPGDFIVFFHENKSGEAILCKVIEVRKYESFESALRDINFKEAVPYAESFEEAVEVYKRIYGSSKQKAVFLRIEVLAHGVFEPEDAEKYLGIKRELELKLT